MALRVESGHRWPRERARAGPASTSRSPASRRLVEGELETNVTMDAEDLLLRQFLGSAPRRKPPGGELDPVEAAVSRTWANFYGGPADLSTTIEAYVALRLAGTTRRRRGALSEVHPEPRRTGELPAFHPLWLALFGQWSWDQIPALPPEVIFLPEWFPLNIYDFALGSQTIVALTVVGALRPNRPLGFSIDEPQDGNAARWRACLDLGGKVPAPGSRPSGGTSHHFRPLVFATSPWPEPPNGSFAGRRRTGLGRIQPPWVYSLIALTSWGTRSITP